MSSPHPSTSDVTFRVSVLGFHKGEVQAFISNLLNDYAQVTRELDRLRTEITTLREVVPDRRPTDIAPVKAIADAPTQTSSATTTAREVERILAGAERIADEIRARAKEEVDALRREADERVASTVGDAEVRASTVARDAETDALAMREEAEARAHAMVREAEIRAADLVRDAQGRAAGLVDAAAQQVVELDRQAAAVRAQCIQMRAAIRAVNEAALSALTTIDGLDEERTPALPAKRV